MKVMMSSMHSDTICAIATARGGAIGIIRVSGPQAIEITDKIFSPAGHTAPLSQREPYTLAFGHIKNTENTIIDTVLVSVFRAPHSYTGENSTEISCHGSQYILQQVMQLLIDGGARQALPGEFTQRAFLNGKMDLSQTEAVADLIASTNAATHKMAMSQLRGGFSKKLQQLRDDLLHITSLLELELDFSEEDVEFANREQLHTLALHILETIRQLTDSFQIGNALKKGIPVAIIGETNVGKSTLLNQLLHEERAIVSNIHGTTRDVIEDTINIQGITFRFIDTAGIRQTRDTIENLGIEKTWQKVDEAQIILWMTDAATSSDKNSEIAQTLQAKCRKQTIIKICNKCDTLESYPQDTDTLYISAREGIALDKLQHRLIEAADIPSISENDTIITNLRHYEALTQASKSLSRVIRALQNNTPSDLISEDLRECLFHLAEITGGAITSDEVIGNIFKNFCIGK